jgi:hypothetical protein
MPRFGPSSAFDQNVIVLAGLGKLVGLLFFEIPVGHSGLWLLCKRLNLHLRLPRPLATSPHLPIRPCSF